MHTFDKLFAVALATFALAFAAGCSGTSTGGDPVDPLLRACSGTFTCREGSSAPVQSTLSKSNGSCYAGKLRLDPDHTVYSEADNEGGWNWSGDLDAFTICVDGSNACFRCTNDARTAETRSAEATEAPPASGKCIGSPKACAGRSNADCFPDTGCNWSSSLGECSASTRPLTACSDITASDRCAMQGCSWMPEK